MVYIYVLHFYGTISHLTEITPVPTCHDKTRPKQVAPFPFHDPMPVSPGKNSGV